MTSPWMRGPDGLGCGIHDISHVHTGIEATLFPDSWHKSLQIDNSFFKRGWRELILHGYMTAHRKLPGSAVTFYFPSTINRNHLNTK